ncbi:MAG: AbrB/MazE/SpoVT family DNA-binding domain-containing protein [Anaerolineae bacterium]|nr:AbrB/MazE/SpoVT family DNA-binding domain-containing protein [Anaerolineae bacterium]
MMIISTVGRRGRITVPRAIRRLLNLKEGDRVAFIQREDKVILGMRSDSKSKSGRYGRS